MVSTADDGGGAVRPVEDNSAAADTQPFNSDWFASSSPGENVGYDDDVFVDTRKVSFDDTVPVEDIFETQVVNYGEETQAPDDLDFVGSMATQMIDEFSEHVVLDSEGECSDTTEILGTGDEVSDDDGEALAEVEGQFPSYDNSKDEQSVDQTNASSNPQSNSGLVPRFTSVRIKALRSSALVAQGNALEDSGNGFCSNLNCSHSTEQLTSCDEIVKDSNAGENIDKEKEPDCGIRSKVNSSTVRRLFTVDSISKDVDISHTSSITGAKEIIQPLTVNEELAGLSYVDLQEPGDASQADALAFVERLIDETKTSFDDELSLGSCGGRKFSCIPTAKGPQSLAKKTIKRSIGGTTGIFDWDDRLEDEGGGDIFIRRKDDFLGVKEPGKSFTDPLKSRSNMRTVCRGNKKKLEGAIHSDSKVVVRKFKVNENKKEGTLRNTRKDLLDGFHEQANRNLTEPTGQPEVAVAPENCDVGLDTQLAADAVEILLNADPLSDHDGSDAKEKHYALQYPTRKSKRTASSKLCASDDSDDSGVNTRQLKKRKNDVIKAVQTSVSSPKQSNKVVLERDAGPVLMTRRRVISDGVELSISRGKKSIGMVRRVRPDADEYSIPHDQKTLKVLPSKTSEPKYREATLGLQLDSSNNCKVPSLRRGRSAKRKSSPEEVAVHTTIARRTRKSFVVSPLVGNEPAEVDEHKDHTKDENGLDQSRADTVDEETVEASNAVRLTSSKSEKPVPVTPEKMLKGVIEASISASTSPVGSVTTNAASPVCIGNGLGKNNLATTSLREINNLCSIDLEPIPEVKDSRKRRNLTDVRVIFSRHLKEDVFKRQKKLLDRLKVSMASSILDATHFVTDKFVRTRNMLEAIAAGKPVVTPLWLEHVARANYYIDEQKYILRDAKKEKEIGFNMEVSLAHARQYALLQGRKVLITQNAKPSKEILFSLVKAVHGEPIERVGRSALKDDSLIKDLLVLSCDEDYEVCVPLLERGAAAHVSELLLNGIVTRKLEYDRHRLFSDHVKRTRSTIRLRKDGEKNFTPVVKNK